MELQGSRELAVTRQQAWDALNDPEVLKACIPGCSSIEATGENAYDLVNAIKIGPVSAKFKSTITLSDINAPVSYTLDFEGNGGAAGFGKGTAKVALQKQGAGCELNYDVTATVGGKVAQVGQRLIDGVAKSMAEKFFTNFDEEMQRRHPSSEAADGQGPAPDAVDAAATPATSEAAPPGQPKSGMPVWVWVVLAIVVVIAIYLLAS
ncbi:MAG: carbon monoxide dehydrogenase subunit G [Candidatus Cloacimonetes bacterium]|nr:carbon monoxide dehydrogenase subunit G [Candidatus Cloacimonadota bacterium]MCK9515599.1 carbon monoxide dehydrogenase subunit G [Ottowia sp.]